MTSTWHVLFSFVMLQTAAAAADAEPLGRLFFTPEQRALLKSRGQSPDAPMAPADTIAIDGVVSRSSGKATVWVNGRPQHEGAAGNPVRVSSARPSHVSIAIDDATRVSLRAGETFHRTGQRKDVVEAGAIRIHTDHGPATR